MVGDKEYIPAERTAVNANTRAQGAGGNAQE
jgi:hypothetical protein